MSTQADEYARNAAALGTGPSRDGAPALFDAALTNAMVAVVSHEWPGAQHKPGRPDWLLSASELLRLLRDKCVEVAPGVHRVRASSANWPWPFDVAVNTLLDAVVRLQSARHGRGGSSEVTAAELTALRDLDGHPSLRVLSRHEWDQREDEDRAAEADTWTRAAAYCELIGDEELDRRASIAPQALPTDLKERLTGYELQECPVCDRESIVVESIDDFGYGIGVGTCFACGYYRRKSTVDREASNHAWQIRLVDE